MKERQKCLSLLRARFPDEEFSDAGLELVHCGRHANARVFRWRGGGRDWIIKDFSSCAWLARALVGRWATRREFRALTRLKNLRGVAGNATRLGPCTVAYDFIEGESLAARRTRDLPPAFFREFRRLVWRMHRRGLAHLDLRNMGNVLVGKDGLPWIIDFQSSVTLSFPPRAVRRVLRLVDYSGVCKAWERRCGEPLPENGRAFLKAFNSCWRRLWPFKGYPLTRLAERIRRRFRRARSAP